MVLYRLLSNIFGDILVAFVQAWSQIVFLNVFWAGFVTISMLFSRMSCWKWMQQLWERFWSFGASVSKEGRFGSAREEYLRSDLTLGDWWTKTSRFWLGVGRFYWDNWWFYVACREFFVIGDGGWRRTGSLSLVINSTHPRWRDVLGVLEIAHRVCTVRTALTSVHRPAGLVILVFRDLFSTLIIRPLPN